MRRTHVRILSTCGHDVKSIEDTTSENASSTKPTASANYIEDTRIRAGDKCRSETVVLSQAELGPGPAEFAVKGRVLADQWREKLVVLAVVHVVAAGV